MKYLILILTIIASLSCQQMKAPQNTDKHLTIHLKENDIIYQIESASYNIRKEKTWYEFTLDIQTIELAERDYHPNVELSIVLKDIPKLKPGLKWIKQPCYIDDVEIGNITNYYEWCHEGFDDFNLEILSIKNNKIECVITGYIILNHQEDKPVKVSIHALFDHNKNLERSFN